MKTTRFVLAAILSLATSFSYAAPVQVFGPKKFQAKPNTASYSQSFNHTQNKAQGVITVVNGDGSDLSPVKCPSSPLLKVVLCKAENLGREVLVKLTRASSIEVSVNGQAKVTSIQLPPTKGSYQASVVINKSNNLSVKVKGLPFTEISVGIKAESAVVNQPPVANFTFNPNNAVAPVIVSFSGLTSTDDKGITAYEWNFGDGGVGTGAVVDHLYNNSGTYAVKLTVRDAQGASGTKTMNVVVIKDTVAPILTITKPVQGSTIQNSAVVIQGSANERLQSVTAQLNGESVYSLNLSADAMSFNGSIATGINGARTLSVIAKDIAGNSTTKVVNFTYSNSLPPLAKLVLKTPATGVAPYMVLLDGSQSSDPQGQALTYAWEFGDGGTSSAVGLATHNFENPGNYSIKLTVTNQSGLSDSKSISVVVNAPVLPPDPVTVAPPLVQNNVPVSFDESVSFLYEGSNPTQKNVAVGAIDESRVGVIRGQVVDENNQPLDAVKVTVNKVSGLGYTLTRQDGFFNIAVNGGGETTVQYELNGYLPAQRTVNIRHNDYASVDTTVLVKTDSKVTKISNNATVSQVVTASTIQDNDGQRTAKIIIPASTEASIELPGGGTMQLPSLSLRVTEYTVGDKGPQRMPASLPQTTAYTYAVDVTADEALALGAKHINFSKPVSFYTDNFLGFAPGTIVPVGSYDYDQGIWVPQKSGLVIQVMSIQNGRAVLDIAGNSVAATTTELAGLGIDDDELIKIASQYAAGKSFWRAQISRFSPIDLNWEMYSDGLPPSDAVDSNDPNCPECGTQTANASTIEHLNQNLRETLPLVGIDFDLSYSSKSSANAASSIPTKLSSNNNISPLVQYIQVTYNVAGQSQTQFFPPAANLVNNFVWDGKDAFGRKVEGRTKANVVVTYNYPSFYLAPRTATQTFGTYPIDFKNTNVSGREYDQVSTNYEVYLGGASQSNIGQWGIPIYHNLDVKNKVLYFGNGSMRGGVNPIHSSRRGVEVVAGNLSIDNSPDGTPAKDAALFLPRDIYYAKDRSIYFSQYDYTIRRIKPDGTMQKIAYLGEGQQPPAPVDLSQIADGIQFSEGDGGELYFCDFTKNVIRKIDKLGNISIFAGTNLDRGLGDGGPARQADISSCKLKFFQGSLYVQEYRRNLIRQITPDGIIHTIAGAGVDQYVGQTYVELGEPLQGYSPDGTLATEAKFHGMYGIDFLPSGELLFADSRNGLIRKINKLGRIETIAGILNPPADNKYPKDGALAKDSYLGHVYYTRVTPDGTIFYMEDLGRIRYITADGKLHTLVGNVEQINHDFAGNPPAVAGTFASQLKLSGIYGYDFSPDGEVYFSELAYSRILKVALPGSVDQGSDGQYTVASEDGSEVYKFNDNGQHVSTINGLTGAVKYSFARNSEGFLVTITDGDGNVTQLNRNSANQVTQIISPYGQVNNLFYDSQNNLSQVQLPSGDNYRMAYGANNLLVSFQKPTGATSTFEYDAFGNLIKDTNSEGGFIALSKQYVGGKLIVTANTAEGVSQSTSKVEWADETEMLESLPTGELRTIRTFGGLGEIISGGRLHYQSRATSSDVRFSTPVSFERYREEGHGNTYRVEEKTLAYERLSSMFDFKRTETRKVNGVVRSVASYDSANKALVITSGENRVSSMVVDHQSRPLSVGVGNLTPTTFTYDSQGRLSTSTRGSRISSNTYGSNGLISSTRDALNRVYQYQYDQNLRKIKDIYPDGRESTYQYDGNGNLISITPPGRPTHQLGFNFIDLVSSYTAPSVGGNSATTYEYDKNKRLKKMTRPDGQTVVNSYVFGRDLLQSTTIPTGQFAYQYDQQGRLQVARSPDLVVTSMTYAGDLITAQYSEVPLISSLIISYNSLLKPSSITAQGHTINYSYDKDEYLTSAGNEVLTYDTNSLLNLVQLGVISESRSYNSFGEPLSINHKAGSTALLNQTFTRDPLGRISSKTDGPDSFSYTYDSSGRLTDVVKNGVNVGHYNYDNNGNRTSASVRGVNFLASTDNQDRLLTYGTKSFTYNLGGDLTSITDSATGITRQFAYDVFSNLKQAVVPGKSIQYVADFSNRRVAKRVNGVLVQGFVYQSQAQVASELDGSGNAVARFVYASKSNSPDFMIKGGITYKFIHDQLGSIRQVVNASSGAVMQDMKYDEFGVVLSDSNPGFQPFGFAGGIYDRDTGLVRFGARDYDASIGRWTTKDPIGFGGGDSNLYSYSANDPVNLIDPSGLKVGDWWDVSANINRAYEIAKEEYAKRPTDHNNKGDAMRHAEWMRRTTQETNLCTAWLAGTAHEFDNLIHGGDINESLMDLHNNYVGRNAGRNNTSVDQSRLITSPASAGINPYGN